MKTIFDGSSFQGKGKKRSVGWFPASYVKLLAANEGGSSAAEPGTNNSSGRERSSVDFRLLEVKMLQARSTRLSTHMRLSTRMNSASRPGTLSSLWRRTRLTGGRESVKESQECFPATTWSL